MANEVFWDTSGLFALLNKKDPQHDRAKALVAELIANGRGSVTTDAVIGECCTLLVAREKAFLIPKLLDSMETTTAPEVVHIDSATFAETCAFLRKHLDHSYSFVDCTSFVVMNRMGLRESATTDGHFVEAGFTALLR